MAKRAHIIVSLVVFPLSVFAQECPKFKLKPGDVNVRAYLNVMIPAHCVPSESFECPGGKKAASSSINTDGKSLRLGMRCFHPDDKRIEKYINQRRELGITLETEEGKKTTIDEAQKAKTELRAGALANGVPGVIFERAYANYLEQMKQGKTSRGCFMAADLTTPEKGRVWTLCLGKPVSISEVETYWGSGGGPGCLPHLFRNNQSSCAKFFGNKPGYCLSAGGNYITGEVERQGGMSREFVQLIGLDKNDNDNTEVRNVGIHQTSTDDGTKSYVGATDPINYSQGCLTIPFRGSWPIQADMTEYSKRQPQGGMPLYVYPSKADIVEFRNTGKAPYWNEKCAKDIGKPAWLGVSEYFAPTPTEIGVFEAEGPAQKEGALGAPASVKAGVN